METIKLIIGTTFIASWTVTGFVALASILIFILCHKTERSIAFKAMLSASWPFIVIGVIGLICHFGFDYPV